MIEPSRYAKQLSAREILKARLSEPGGGSRWKPRAAGRNDLDAARGKRMEFRENGALRTLSRIHNLSDVKARTCR